jgi:hypothetical protein
MTELPEIIIEPITVPATTEKVYDKMWITDFIVKSESPQTTTLYAILRPYCSTTGEILVQAGTEQVISLNNLFGILGGNTIEPKLSPETVAMGGQVMGLTLMFLKAVLADKAKPDEVLVIEEPIVEEEEVPVVEELVIPNEQTEPV